MQVLPRIVLRPEGHPFRRMATLPEDITQADDFIVVDDGPGHEADEKMRRQWSPECCWVTAVPERDITRTLAAHIARAALTADMPRSRREAIARIGDALVASGESGGFAAHATRETDGKLLAGDGRLQPAEWLRSPEDRIVKRNGTGTDWEHMGGAAARAVGRGRCHRRMGDACGE